MIKWYCYEFLNEFHFWSTTEYLFSNVNTKLFNWLDQRSQIWTDNDAFSFKCKINSFLLTKHKIEIEFLAFKGRTKGSNKHFICNGLAKTQNLDSDWNLDVNTRHYFWWCSSYFDSNVRHQDSDLLHGFLQMWFNLDGFNITHLI